MFYALYALAIFLLAFWCGMWMVHLTALIHAKLKLHRKVKLLSDVPHVGVSILKPIKGLDNNLKENLETFFTMDYPVYQILFCVEESTDPALPKINELLEKYPNVDAKTITGGSTVGANPKICNMHPGYLEAKYEFVLISDSGIKMRKDTLLDMMDHMTEKVGIVHQMPFTCDDREGFSATLEKTYFGTAHSRIYLFADFMQINCHTGMSTLIRKKLLDDVGGLETFSCYLAEDFFIGKSIMDRGYKMKISSHPALQNTSCRSVQSFRERLKRWTKLRAAMVPYTILLEPLSECFILGALTSWAVYTLFRWDPLIFYLVHILFWFLFDWTLLKVIQNGALPFSKFYFIISWFYREISGPFIFLSALRNSKIKWHSRWYYVQTGGIAEEISAKINV